MPTNLRILLLGQNLGGNGNEDETTRNASETVLEHVIRSDTHREQALSEEKRTFFMPACFEALG
jgi:hypothetical protein